MTEDTVRSVYGMESRVIEDPATRQALVLPIGRHHDGHRHRHCYRHRRRRPSPKTAAKQGHDPEAHHALLPGLAPWRFLPRLPAPVGAGTGHLPRKRDGADRPPAPDQGTDRLPLAVGVMGAVELVDPWWYSGSTAGRSPTPWTGAGSSCSPGGPGPLAAVLLVNATAAAALLWPLARGRGRGGRARRTPAPRTRLAAGPDRCRTANWPPPRPEALRWQAGAIAGPALAGLVVAYAGNVSAYTTTVVCFCASVLMCRRLSRCRPSSTRPNHPARHRRGAQYAPGRGRPAGHLRDRPGGDALRLPEHHLPLPLRRTRRRLGAGPDVLGGSRRLAGGQPDRRLGLGPGATACWWCAARSAEELAIAAAAEPRRLVWHGLPRAGRRSGHAERSGPHHHLEPDHPRPAARPARGHRGALHRHRTAARPGSAPVRWPGGPAPAAVWTGGVAYLAAVGLLTAALPGLQSVTTPAPTRTRCAAPRGATDPTPRSRPRPENDATTATAPDDARTAAVHHRLRGQVSTHGPVSTSRHRRTAVPPRRSPGRARPVQVPLRRPEADRR